LIQDYNSLQSGSTRIEIIGAKTQALGEDAIVLTRRAPIVSIYEKATRSGNSRIKTIGVSSVLAVRVKSKDSEVSLSAAELSEGLFTAPVNFASQINRCSAGALQFVPAIGENIQGGVGELYIDENTIGVYNKNLHGILRQEFQTKFGDESNYDHILYCLPQGTAEQNNPNWIAYAYGDTSFSYYNNEWCGSLTTKMHEVGHNLGVGHSGEGPEGDYEDRTCVMGVSFLAKEGPQECFNGCRHWSLGWFANHQITVQPPWHGKLVAFVDYADIADGDYAIVNVGDLYLQYNRAKTYNWAVGEKQNQVTIVKSGVAADDTSTMLTGLDMTSTTFTNQENGMNIVIEVCEPGSYGSVEYFQIGIYEVRQASSCFAPSPTPPPTPAPVATFTLATPPPTPVPHPSATPSSSPSFMPSLAPRPTQAPEPTSMLTPRPTKDPTPQATREPTPDLTPPPLEEVVPEKDDPDCISVYERTLYRRCW
jgi:hypothetical protein